MQLLYVSVLNAIEKNIGSKISEKTKDALLLVSLVSIFAVSMYGNMQRGLLDSQALGYKELFAINTLLLCLAIVFSVKGQLNKIEWNKWVYIPWVISGIMLTLPIPDMADRLATMCFGLLIWLIFPALYLVWANRKDYEKLFTLAAWAVVITGIAFYLVNLVAAPIEIKPHIGYQGVVGNPNTIGIASVAIAVAALSLVDSEKKSRFAFYALEGIALGFAWVSASRASILAIALVIIAWLVGFKLREKKLKFVLVAMLIIAISALATSTFITATAANNTGKTEGTESAEILEDKMTKGDTVSQMSSGRIEIWKFYISNIGLIGHSREGGEPYVPAHGKTVSAHNTYIEIAYRSGVVAGLCYGIVALFAAAFALKYIFDKKRTDNRWMFIPLAVLAFGVLSNLERAIYPVEKMHIFLYFLAIAPMFFKNNNFKSNAFVSDTKKCDQK